MGTFKGVRNNEGRPKGALNKNTAELKAVVQSIVNNELNTLEKHLSTLEPKDRADILIKLLPYVMPKQQELKVETIENEFTAVTINLISDADTN